MVVVVASTESCCRRLLAQREEMVIASLAMRTLVMTPAICVGSMSRARVRFVSTLAAEPAPVLEVIAVPPEVMVDNDLRTMK